MNGGRRIHSAAADVNGPPHPCSHQRQRHRRPIESQCAAVIN